MVPPLKLYSYCRLLPLRETAKSFEANETVGRASSDIGRIWKRLLEDLVQHFARASIAVN